MTPNASGGGGGSFWTRPHWQAVGAIAAILGLALAYAIYQWQKDDVAPAPTNQIRDINNGTCVAQGGGDVDLKCTNVPTPKSIGKVDISWFGGTDFLFHGTASELPTPPDYPPDKERGHCSDWMSWFAGQPRIYALQPGIAIALQTGVQDALSINRVSVAVTDRKPLAGEYVAIRCQYGAGGDAGHYIDTDTRTGKTTVVDAGTGIRASMPPYVVKQNGIDSSAAMLGITSHEGYLYAGRWSASMLYNGEAVTREFGFGDIPGVFRWVGGEHEEGYPISDSVPRYDWHLTAKRWVKVDWQPPSVTQ